MVGDHYSYFQKTIQKFASSRFGAWSFSKLQHHFDRATFKLSGGKTTMSGVLSGLPVAMLTTTGARSGLPRTVPLLAIREDDGVDQIGFIATNWGQNRYPAWYFNLKKNPKALCQIDDFAGNYTAHEAEGEEHQHYWGLATQTYIGFRLYKQRIEKRRIPIMVMTKAA